MAHSTTELLEIARALVKQAKDAWNQVTPPEDLEEKEEFERDRFKSLHYWDDGIMFLELGSPGASVYSFKVAESYETPWGIGIAQQIVEKIQDI